jgi:anti-anti-sigma factor
MSRSPSTSLIVRAPAHEGLIMLPTRSPAWPPVSASGDALDMHVEIHPGVPAVAEIGGEIDMASAPWLRETLLLAIRRHGPVICVDLQGVTFLDCSGVNVFLATARRARLEGGRMRVVRPSAQAWRVITLLGLQDVLTRDDERAEAVTAPGCKHYRPFGS